MSTLADVVIRDALVNRPAAGIAGRLFYDTTNSELQRDNGSSWDAIEGDGAAETLPESIIDAAGDLIIGDGADSAVRLARGTDGQALRATATTVAFEDDYFALTFAIDGGGSALTTGRKLPIRAPMAGVIVSATAMLDAGTITVDIWKDTFANYLPTDADSITASAPVTVTANAKSEDTTLTGWTTAVAAGDILIPNVDAVATATWAVIQLRVRKT